MKTSNAWRLVVVIVASVGLLALAGCGGDDGDGGGGTDVAAGADTGGGGTADTGGGGATTDFPAGTFQLTTHEVDDQCLDGGLAILFQPDGVGTPYDLANTTEFPAYDSLPQTFTMALQAPFSAMEVNLEAAGANLMTVTDSTQTDLVVDAANYGDCTVDMVIDADIVIVDKDNIDVTATVEAKDWTGDQCPVVSSDPCTIILTMKGARQ